MRPWRGSLRVRLTLLFGGLFLVAGAALLGITYGLDSHATSGIIVSRAASGPGSAGPPALAPLKSQAAGTRAAENDALLAYSGVALAIMAAASLVLGWVVAGQALSPLRRITTAAQRISATNLHERLSLDGPDDDLRELADTIDGLFARLDASLHAQRQFVANASHELRTPLSRSRTLLEVALRDPAASEESLRGTCERVLAAGEETERLLEALLTLARGQRGLSCREQLDLAVITRDVLATRGGQAGSRGLAVETVLGPAPLTGDRALVERAVANLADNAIRYNTADGTIWVTTGSEDGRAVLSVANTGPRIADGDTARLLAPFQRGREADRTRSRPDDGLGLGLSIVQAIAAAHGAGFRVTPRLDGGGLTARLVFPAPSMASTSCPPLDRRRLRPGIRV